MDHRAFDSDAISASTATPGDFATVFDRHFDAVHAYLQRRIGGDLADELSAETFLIAFDTRARYDVSRPDARPWLFGIATNLLHRHRRHELRELRAYARSGADPVLDAFDGVDARIDASGIRRELVEALTHVPAEELDALLLFAWADFSYAEIAQALEIPIGTVRSRSRVPGLPGPGQYLFTRSTSGYVQGTARWSVLVPSEREVWISFDGSRRGRVREVRGKPRFVSAGQRAGWVAAGSPPLPRAGRVEDSPLSSGGFLDASELPPDPATLRRLIEARGIRGVEGPPGEAETFTLIGDMLRETYLPSGVRAAIYELTAELPGVELLGEVEDPVGRAGTGIAFTDRRRGTRHELILDPATSVLLGERESIVRSGAYGFKAPPGTLIGYAAYLESKVVDSVHGSFSRH